MNLEDLRKNIDDVDNRIVDLIGERVRIAEEIGRGKKTQNKVVEDKDRENRVLAHVRQMASEK
ncbi:MAG: chorismate mutase, partial [Dehalococcoidales bacterium]